MTGQVTNRITQSKATTATLRTDFLNSFDRFVDEAGVATDLKVAGRRYPVPVFDLPDNRLIEQLDEVTAPKLVPDLVREAFPNVDPCLAGSL